MALQKLMLLGAISWIVLGKLAWCADAPQGYRDAHCEKWVPDELCWKVSDIKSCLPGHDKVLAEEGMPRSNKTGTVLPNEGLPVLNTSRRVISLEDGRLDSLIVDGGNEATVVDWISLPFGLLLAAKQQHNLHNLNVAPRLGKRDAPEHRVSNLITDCCTLTPSCWEYLRHFEMPSQEAMDECEKFDDCRVRSDRATCCVYAWALKCTGGVGKFYFPDRWVKPPGCSNPVDVEWRPPPQTPLPSDVWDDTNRTNWPTQVEDIDKPYITVH